MSPLISYKEFNFRAETEQVIEQANEILHEYSAQGYDLTLRQLYYQFVARDLIPNTQREYKRLGSIVNDGRLAGEIDWAHITDRTRFTRIEPAWSSPDSIIKSAASSYQIDLWKSQPNYVEVWVEKDALVGVVERACAHYRLPFLSCRGYVSQSEMWEAAQRFGRKLGGGKEKIVILHLGDHDPSGIDMSRDIDDRISEFLTGDGHAGYDESVFEVDRIALNMDQVRQYAPPPNPTKLTDSRAQGYLAVHGNESWELDALEPTVLDALITTSATPLIDAELMDERRDQEEEERKILTACSERWSEVAAFLNGGAA